MSTFGRFIKQFVAGLCLVAGIATASYYDVGGSSFCIGCAVTGGTPNSVLFIDGSGNLAESLDLQFDDTTDIFTLDGTSLFATAVDPGAGAGTAANPGSLAFFNSGGVGTLYAKFGAADTDWTNVLTGASGWSLLGNTGTTAGTNFIGTTDAIDFVLKTNATEALRITSAQAIDTLLGAGVVHSDASGVLSSSAIVNADVDASAAIDRSKLASGTAHQILVNDVSGVMSGLGPLTNGQLLIGSTGAAASVASLTGTANQITVTPGAGSITLSTPQDIATTSSPTFAGVDLVGQTDATELEITLDAGQTAKAIQVYSSGFTDLMSVDASGNLDAQDITGVDFQGSTYSGPSASPASAGVFRLSNTESIGWRNNANNGDETITLTASDVFEFTDAISTDTSLILEDPGAGTDTITIQSPTLGAPYTLTLPVDDGTNNQVLATNGSGVLSWASDVGFADPMTTRGDMIYRNSSNVTDRLPVGAANTVVRTDGTDVSYGKVALGTDVSGTLPIANGGTNNGSLSVSAGVVYYGDGSKLVGLAAGNSGEVLQSNGAGAPSWVSPGSGGGFTVYGQSSLYTASGCNWTGSSATFASFAADTDCATPTVTGSVTAPATDIPGIVLASAPAGTYKITAVFTGTSTTGNPSFRLSDGASASPPAQMTGGSDNTSNRIVTLVWVVTYGSSGTRNIEIQYRDGGSGTQLTANSAFIDLYFIVESY